jgi:hypothetical protein
MIHDGLNDRRHERQSKKKENKKKFKIKTGQGGRSSHPTPLLFCCDKRKMKSERSQFYPREIQRQIKMVSFSP